MLYGSAARRGFGNRGFYQILPKRRPIRAINYRFWCVSFFPREMQPSVPFSCGHNFVWKFVFSVVFSPPVRGSPASNDAIHPPREPISRRCITATLSPSGVTAAVASNRMWVNPSHAIINKLIRWRWRRRRWSEGAIEDNEVRWGRERRRRQNQ